MAWNKKYYKECKQHMDWMVSHHPWCYDGDLGTWLKGWNKFTKKFADEGDYEAAQACKDAIIEFAEKMLGEPIPKETLLVFDEK